MALFFYLGSIENTSNQDGTNYSYNNSSEHNNHNEDTNDDALSNLPIVDKQEEEILSNAMMTSEEDYNVLDLIKVNDLSAYRGLMFNDYETAGLIIGAGLVKKILKDGNVTAAVIATEKDPFSNGGNQYKASFNGRYALVFFRGEPKLLVNDVLLFKGLITNQLYKFADDYNFTQKMPLLVALHYKIGDFNELEVANYFINSAMRAKAKADWEKLVDESEKARTDAESRATSTADSANAAADAAHNAAIHAATTAYAATAPTMTNTETMSDAETIQSE